MMQINDPILTVDRVSKRFDVSAPWLNRVLEGKPRLLVNAVNEVSLPSPAAAVSASSANRAAANPPWRGW